MTDSFAAADAILYVDDEELARKYFARLIGVEHTVLLAADADAAMAVLQQSGGRVGVVVTDFRMPGANGADLLRQLSEQHPRLVRILVTAYADKDLLMETINTGDLFRVVEKPLDIAVLRATLREAIDKARERRIMS